MLTLNVSEEVNIEYLCCKENKMLQNFRKVALAEGWSYLIVLLITWPLKYFEITGIPNKIVGMAHGLLFITYVVMAVSLKKKEGWSFVKLGVVLVASLIPFGTFYIDHKYLKNK